MSPALEIRSEGFRASLEVRGFPVSIDGQSVRVVKSSDVEADDLRVKMEDSGRQMCWLHVLREDFQGFIFRLGRKVEVGDELRDGQTYYRVTQVKDVKAYPDVRLMCEEYERETEL
jgi:hypothetical protein